MCSIRTGPDHTHMASDSPEAPRAWLSDSYASILCYCFCLLRLIWMVKNWAQEKPVKIICLNCMPIGTMTSYESGIMTLSSKWEKVIERNCAYFRWPNMFFNEIYSSFEKHRRFMREFNYKNYLMNLTYFFHFFQNIYCNFVIG